MLLVFGYVGHRGWGNPMIGSDHQNHQPARWPAATAKLVSCLLVILSSDSVRLAQCRFRLVRFQLVRFVEVSQSVQFGYYIWFGSVRFIIFGRFGSVRTDCTPLVTVESFRSPSCLFLHLSLNNNTNLPIYLFLRYIKIIKDFIEDFKIFYDNN